MSIHGMRNGDNGDWWRPLPGSKADARLQFLAAALSIGAGSASLAALTWTLASTNDGRIKALLWWAIGVTALGAFVYYRLLQRESKESRYGRALENLHMAHHTLRDAAYSRYIARAPEADWKLLVEQSLGKFARSFSIASGASCHVTVKIVTDTKNALGAAIWSADELEVDTYCRSVARPFQVRPNVQRNTIGHNTDFRYLFNAEANNRCWFHNDLLTLENYDNPHWPESPSVRNVPYRSTMVWPIRKVLREGGAADPNDYYIHGFLTVDSSEPHIFVYERHFHLGAGFADHLLSVLWDPDDVRQAHEAVVAPRH